MGESTRPTPIAPARSTLDRVRRGVLWSMVASLALAAMLGTALALAGGFNRDLWRVEATLLGLAMHCGIGLAFLRGRAEAAPPLRVVVPLAIFGANVLVLLACTWIIDRPDRGWAQTAALVAAAVLTAPAWPLLRTNRLLPLAGWTIIVSLLASGLTIYDLWSSRHRPFTGHWDELLACAWTAAIASSLVTVLYAWRPLPSLRWLRAGSSAAIALAAVLYIAGILDRSLWDTDVFRRVTLGASILSVCGVLINAALVRLLRPQAAALAADAPPTMNVELRCPACREDLVQPTGASECPHCRTRFEIRVVPRACIRCGFDLSGLPEPTCPECGSAY